MKFRLFPPQKDFFKMLADQSAKAEEAARALVEFFENPTEENAEAVHRIEKEADELRRIIIDELNVTFVTPIDREDIFALSRAIDDVVDYADTTVEEIMLFKIKPDDYMKRMVEVLLGAAENLNSAIKELHNDVKACDEHLIRARKSENRIEHYYREGLVELFRSDDVRKILKSREIYRHLSNAADRVVEAANFTGDILVKTT